MPGKTKFKVNELVMAKWPGSPLWFEGTVVDFNDIEYQIRFSDENKSEYVLKNKDVKAYSNWVRARSRSRGRSRSKGRSKKKKAPVESDQVEETKEENKVVEEEVVAEVKEDTPKPTVRIPRAEIMPRTSTPTKQLADVTNNEADGQLNNVKTADTKDEMVSPIGLSARLCGLTCRTGLLIKSGICALVPSVATIKTIPGALMLIALPVVLNQICTKNKCTVQELPDIPRSLEYYFDLRAVAIVAVFLMVQILLYLLPLGRKITHSNGATIRCNGHIALVMSLIVVAVLVYLEYDVLLAYALYRHLLATATVCALLLSLIVHIQARHTPDDLKNPDGNSGIFLPDLFWGRETNPTFGSLDLKFFMFRVAVISWVIINVLIVLKDVLSNPGQYSPTLIVAVMLQILYAFDVVWFEESLLTTYGITREGCGLYMIMAVMTYPFVGAVYTRIVLNHRTELEWYYLSAIAALHVAGYILMRGSNSQKHAFRSNPSDPALAHLESLPTSAGTRLLVSGWWGFVRHPNYLGDILIFISWAIISGLSVALPWILSGLTVIILISRVFEVEAACKRKYGTAWDSYTERVKYRLIPKVF